MAAGEKEQEPLLDLPDKVTERRQRGQRSVFDYLNKAVDEGTTKELDVEEVGHKIFGKSLNLMGKVKFHMGAMKKVDRE